VEEEMSKVVFLSNVDRRFAMMQVALQLAAAGKFIEQRFCLR